MTASAEERESALRPSLDEARRQVADLETAVKTAEENAHSAYVRGDVPAGDGAHAQAGELKRQLESAAARLTAFEAAAHAVAEQRHRETVEAQLARTRQARAEALAESQRQAAEIRPALASAKRSIQLAQQAEDLERSLEVEVYELEVHLGMRERGIFHANANTVRAMLERSAMLRDLLAMDV